MTLSQTNSSALPSSPFDNPYADVILRSSDNVDFPMLKINLIQSSPLFESMFSLPQPTNPESVDEQKNGLPLVPLTETGDVLDVLLRFCIPRTPPQLTDLRGISQVAEGAKKYQIEWASETARQALGAFAEKEPVRVYAIACRFGFEEEARLAARRTLLQPLLTTLSCDVEELDSLSAQKFRRLLKYQETCKDHVLKRVSSYPWLSSFTTKIWESSCCGRQVAYIDSLNRKWNVQAWWEQYMRRLVERLKADTDERVISAEDVLLAFLRSSTTPCHTCVSLAPVSLTFFAQKMAAEVRTAIDQVSTTVKILP